MTTNVGYEYCDIGFNKNSNNNKVKDLFGIPLINRIDKVVNFNYLDSNSIKKIVKERISKLKKKYTDKKISISSIVIDEIVDKTNYKEFGARKIDKIIKTDIEDIIIENMIKGNNNISIKSIKVSC